MTQPVPSAAKVVICLATYRADPELLARTLDSIKRQSFTDWVCLVRDDASPAADLDRLRELVRGDSRFLVSVSKENQGYVGNFESLLRDVPATATYVALADQDDVWYEDRVEQLVTQLDSRLEASMAYHNVELTTRSGLSLSPGYQVGRPPLNGASLLDLLMANLVTGWTCMFRRAILDVALPFPKPGPWVHDHWLACVARSGGPLVYIARPLGSYVQHGSNAVGAGDRGWAFWGRHVGVIPLARLVGFMAGLTGRPVFGKPTAALVDWATAQYRVRQSFTSELMARGLVAEGGRDLFPTQGRSRWLKGLIATRAVAGGEAFAASLHLLAGDLARRGRIDGAIIRRRLRRWTRR